MRRAGITLPTGGEYVALAVLLLVDVLLWAAIVAASVLAWRGLGL